MNNAAAREAAGQFVRFAIVGLISNGLLFLLYLAITAIGLAPKMGATLCYGVGVLQTFSFNRSWSFGATGARAGALRRYVVLYALGYVANIALLAWFVDRLGYSHRIVQGLIILGLAITFFLLQKFWVFRPMAPTQYEKTT